MKNLLRMKFTFLLLPLSVIVFLIINGFQGSSQTVQGKVTDGSNPIGGARVRVIGENDFTVTDEQGFFFLSLPKFDGKVFIAAGKDGWYNNGVFFERNRKNPAIVLEKVPNDDDEDYDFKDPTPAPMGRMGRGMMPMMSMMQGMSCGTCHENVYNQWKRSTMAKSTINPWVLDFYKGTNSAGEKNIEPGFTLDFPRKKRGECADCHAPSAALKNPGNTDLSKVAKSGGVDAKGVHCDFCHKTRNVRVSNDPGVQAIEMGRREGSRMMMMRRIFSYGPYEDVVAMPMDASYNSMYKKSEFCSSCHQYATRLPKGKNWNYLSIYPDAEKFAIYEDGRVVPSQWTYQEWLEWQEGLSDSDPDRGRQCQSCHMNWTKEMLPYDEYIVTGMQRQMLGIRRSPDRIHPHTFEGATEKRLQGATYMRVNLQQQENRLVVTVEITNVNAGHRIPTGIYLRNIILLVNAFDENGNPLEYIEGTVVPDWAGVGPAEEGYYAGLPGKGFARINGDDKGNVNVPDWRATRIVSDNRIKPKETDTSTYVFVLSSDYEKITGDVRLIYRKAFKSLADKKKWVMKDIIMEEEIF